MCDTIGELTQINHVVISVTSPYYMLTQETYVSHNQVFSCFAIHAKIGSQKNNVTLNRSSLPQSRN